MKILIAEDDQHIRSGLQELLETEGYETIAADNGETALQLFNDAAPNLVLLDIMMPKQSGYDVCREIRRHDTDTPVIFLSAKSEEVDRVLGLELGADDYIMKPFGIREVIARIRAVTRRYLNQQKKPAHSESKPLEFGDLQLYPEELRARRSDQQIELSLRDVRILQLLHANRGKVVDRDSLFNHCWGRDYMPNSRTLDQHISKLRKLVEKNPREPEIVCTVHGVGYRYG